MRGTDTKRTTPRRRAALVVVALVGLSLGHGAATPAPAQAATLGKVAGYGVTTSANGDKIVTAEAERMAAPGHNMVSLEATWAVSSRTANDVRRTSSTVPDQDLLVAARRVREAGMNVMMTVKIFCESCTGTDSGWRGILQPSDRAEFFRNYRAMTNHYAQIAQQAGAAIFFVGSEMNTLQNETAAWRQVILEARTRFGGSIGYQANWDALTGVGFWDDVDISAVSAYFPLSDEPQPNIADLLAAWRDSDTQAHRGSDWFGQIEAFARSHGKPVMFGEIGYQSAIGAAQRPFFKEKFNGVDEQLQADLYQTALTLFEGQSWWLGAIWWEYLVGPPKDDHDYTPRGKLAEQLLTKWYAGQRPPSREQSLVGTTRPSAKADGRPPATGPAQPPTSGRGATAPIAPGRTAPPTPAGSPSAAASQAAAPLTGAVAVPPSLTPSLEPSVAPPSVGTDVRAAPPLPSALAELDVQTVEGTLLRAAERRHRERASVVAGALLVPLVVGHGVGLFRRLRRQDIFAG